MFLILLLVVLLGAGIHIARSAGGSRERAGELLLLWVLVGYCGVPMLVISLGGLAYPGRAAGTLGFPAGNPFQTFLLVAYLGMSVLSLLSLRYRGAYLLGPAVLWGVFFLGATAIHLHHPSHGGGHGGALWIVATHALISVVLAAGLAMSGVLRRPGPAPVPSGSTGR